MRVFFRDFPVLVFSAIFAIFSYIVPKKKGLWLFWPGHEKNKFSGNLKYFFKYVIETDKSISPLWVTKNKDVFSEVTDLSFPVKKYSILPFWQLLKADKILIDTSETDISMGRFSFFQLWHGTGFKNIVALSHSKKNISYRLRKHLSLYKLVVATSKEDQQRKKGSFITNNVFITGSPRNDIFFENGFKSGEYKKSIGLPEKRKIVLYAPTFRDKGDFSPFSNKFWEKVNNWAGTTHTLFAVKKHSGCKKLVVPDNFDNIKDLTRVVRETQELLAVTDILISDYSGIVTDFALTGRPVIFYIFDFEKYKKTCRSLYYDITSTLPGPFAYNENDLLSFLYDEKWFYDRDYQKKYNKFVDIFHQYQDGGSSARLFYEIKGVK